VWWTFSAVNTTVWTHINFETNKLFLATWRVEADTKISGKFTCNYMNDAGNREIKKITTQH